MGGFGAGVLGGVRVQGSGYEGSGFRALGLCGFRVFWWLRVLEEAQFGFWGAGLFSWGCLRAFLRALVVSHLSQFSKGQPLTLNAKPLNAL